MIMAESSHRMNYAYVHILQTADQFSSDISVTFLLYSLFIAAHNETSSLAGLD